MDQATIRAHGQRLTEGDNAKNLTAQEDLIDFAALDREQLPQWIEDLEEGRRLMLRFIRRLREEM